MKMQSTAKILAWVTLAFWLVPWYGKKLFPQFFGQWAVQLTCAVIVAIVAPVAVLMGLRLIFSTNLKKAGFAIVLAAAIPILVNIGILGVGGLQLARVNIGVQRLNESDPEAIRTLIDRSTAVDSADARLKNAEVLYQCFGVQAVWKNSLGNLEQYMPAPEQEAVWRQTKETNQKILETADMLDRLMKEMQWLLTLTITSFALIFLVGLAWLAFGQRANKPDHPTPDPL
jgi:hypothetical protein